MDADAKKLDTLLRAMQFLAAQGAEDAQTFEEMGKALAIISDTQQKLVDAVCNLSEAHTIHYEVNALRLAALEGLDTQKPN